MQRSGEVASLLEIRLRTGRTHQIRVHARHVGHPLLGDSKYESPESADLTTQLKLRRLFLHATKLRFELDGVVYDLQAELDQELASALESAAS